MSEPTPKIEILLDLVERTYSTRDRLTSAEQEPRPLPAGDMPWHLEIRPSALEASELEVNVLDDGGVPFSPTRATACTVLAVDAWITDKVFETCDDTIYVVRIVNTSTHYVAEDICVHLELDPRCDAVKTLLPDGNALIEIQPGRECIKCLSPGHYMDLRFVAISRGPRPGVFPVKACITYDLVYWTRWKAKTSARLELEVHDECRPYNPCRPPREVPPDPAPWRPAPLPECCHPEPCGEEAPKPEPDPPCDGDKKTNPPSPCEQDEVDRRPPPCDGGEEPAEDPEPCNDDLPDEGRPACDEPPPRRPECTPCGGDERPQQEKPRPCEDEPELEPVPEPEPEPGKPPTSPKPDSPTQERPDSDDESSDARPPDEPQEWEQRRPDGSSRTPTTHDIEKLEDDREEAATPPSHRDEPEKGSKTMPGDRHSPRHQNCGPDEAEKMPEKKKKDEGGCAPPCSNAEEMMPIVEDCRLPEGGMLEFSYTFRKGFIAHANRGGRCVYGRRASNGQKECRLESIDDTVFVMDVKNLSHFHLRHVRVHGIRLYKNHEEVKDTLPDGHPVAQLVPDAVYIGSLPRGESKWVALSFITRGVAPGCYTVKFCVDYDIEACTVSAGVDVEINCD